MKKHIIVGIVAGTILLLVYAVTLVLLQGFEHAFKQTTRLWYWLLPLSLGFGTQIGLFSFLRQGLRERRAAETASAATSGTISAGSMVACCAHHLSEVLPLIGLTSLTVFITKYQTFFMIVGIMANIVGITVMLDTIQRLGLCPRLSRFRLNLRLIKKMAIASSILITLIVFLILLWVT